MMITLLAWLWGALKIIIVLGTLITIHELGHFTVAKLCNVKVNKFAIGFGPKIYTKQGKEIEYTIRLIPFGGFVQMEGEEERSDDERAFNKKTVLQRIAIVAAGATVNIVFALVIYFGICSAIDIYYSNVVFELDEGPLYDAGIRTGDKIISINEKNILTQRDVGTIVEESESDMFNFIIERENQKISLPVKIGNSKRGFVGMKIKEEGQEVARVYSKAPAGIAGIKEGDIIVSVNGETNKTTEEIIKEIRKTIDSNIEFGILRGDEEITISVTTRSQTSRFFELECEKIHPGFFKGFVYAIDETWDYFVANVVGTVEIFTGKAENVEVMGPVGIASEISSTAAWEEFFALMSAISLSLRNI